MKKTLQILSFFIVTVLFYLTGNKTEAVSSVGNFTKESSYGSSFRGSDSKGTICLNYSVHANLGSSIASANKVVKQFVYSFFANEKRVDYSFIPTFFKAVVFSKNELIHFTSTDIIFPFHYFW